MRKAFDAKKSPSKKLFFMRKDLNATVTVQYSYSTASARRHVTDHSLTRLCPSGHVIDSRSRNDVASRRERAQESFSLSLLVTPVAGDAILVCGEDGEPSVY